MISFDPMGTVTVTLEDRSLPSLLCPGNISLPAGPECAAHFGDMPEASDNCRLSDISSAPPLPAEFGPGLYTIDYSATDASGNGTSCSLQLEVTDRTPPLLTCPPPLILPADDQCRALYDTRPLQKTIALM